MREHRRKGPKLPLGITLSGVPTREEAPSTRHAQVASVVRRAVQERIVRGLADPRFQGMVSVQEVRMSADLMTATVTVSVMPTDRGGLTLAAMRSAAGFFRSHLRESTRLRSVPHLQFELQEGAPAVQEDQP